MATAFGLMLAMGAGPAVTGELAASRTADPVAEDLPRVLSNDDEALYRRIFASSKRGQWREIDGLSDQLTDRLLLGHVLAERYLHPTAYRSRYGELKAWMAAYADHPDAGAVHKLALHRKAKSESAPVHASDPTATNGGGWAARRMPPKIPPKPLGAADKKKATALKRRIETRLRAGSTQAARELIATAEAERLLGGAELDQLRAAVGHGSFVGGRDQEALEWTGRALERSERYLPGAHWTAGLANWRLGRFATAAGHFEALARRADVSPWVASAAAFWAARSHLFARHPDRVNDWLGVAASHPRTFYGLLARRILGLATPLRWEPTDDEHRALDALKALPAGRRALALLQIGEQDRAERELRALAAVGGADVARGIMVVADRAGLPALALRLHRRLFADGDGFDAAAYPLPPWRPADGFHVDRALIYAVIRQESGFDPDARSPAGASGLMQLMPSTARWVADSTGHALSTGGRVDDPGHNLTLGQRYLAMLLADGSVERDLFRLAAAWNGGPGNLRKWRQSVRHGDDPLLFIESIPSRETRIFIERLLANLWIYRDRMGQPQPSLDALAAGRWPVYIPVDPRGVEMASYGDH
ncbi:MAG: lytic transglycosylase domain-containing protein [Rhodospirillales bacterium]